jgi:small subunit ribosomal protein S15
MALNQQKKAEVMKDYQQKAEDTGSPEVQVALLTAKITDLSEHFKIHKNDNHSRQGLLRMVNHRRKLLDYLKSTDLNRYRELIARLGLRK